MEHFQLWMPLLTILSMAFHGLCASDNQQKITRSVSCDSTRSFKILERDQIELSSPNYPEDYDSFASCSFEFEASEGALLSLMCPSVQIGAMAQLYVIDEERELTFPTKYSLSTNKGTFYHAFSTSRGTVGFINSSFFKEKGFICNITSASPKAATQDCKCGQKGSNRIVGGTEASEDEYPWMAALVRPWKDYNFCGGSLISDSFVLTAAHCTQYEEPDLINVRLGVKTLSQASEGIRMKVLEIIDHPQYQSAVLGYDFSLLKIETVDFSQLLNVRPICLPSSVDSLYDGTTGLITGWGTTSYGGSSSDVLLEAAVPVVSNSICQKKYGNVPITDNMICAGEENVDSCQGDSGGPLIVESDSSYYENVGVVSFGIGCGSPRYFGVYARITAAYYWIVINTASSTYCSYPS